ncbi:DUF4232 domain-containing protein [Actinoplanes derwentensis]|uniref:DUF4232 domain-containing protein n=1 Tax=Actinoplanes derwentensis TaxID=113562 RepID=A0A1H1VF25_9ACTN|nr:DUF4232 domain-containing protein [Actinoplanes derwentensis]GID83716.1 hypothetical protein Ade03nite_26400 [Actinoplanes derwentensis]SDS83398.1 Protein of unknown function [Actinoplanes derwentensis]
MTRNAPRGTAARMLMTFPPALLIVAVAVGLVGAPRTSEAAVGETVTEPSVAPADCLTDDLTGTLIGVPRQAGSGVREAVLQLTNTSTTACQIQGWPEVALVTPPGEVVKVPTEMIGTAAAVIDLEPESSTWSRIQWDVCTADSSGCGVGVALQFIVDPESAGSVAESADVPEADRDGITMTALRVGPFQVTRDADPLS